MKEGCICCANGNDLPDGEYCRACLRGADEIFMKLEGAELDAFLLEIGMKPDELLAQFDAALCTPQKQDLTIRHKSPQIRQARDLRRDPAFRARQR